MGLTEDKYESIESDWESQQQIREELNDKPDELRRFMVEKKIGLSLVLIFTASDFFMDPKMQLGNYFTSLKCSSRILQRQVHSLALL